MAARRSWLLITALCAVTCVHAQVDPAWYQGLGWRLIGPFRGGRVLAVSGIAGDDRHFYFGAVDGGVWATADAGRTWKPIFDSQTVGSIGALAVAPSDPRILYVGSGEADMRSDIAHGNGMYRSADSGGHWSRIGLEDSRQIGRILVDPSDPERVFVAALGHAYGPNAQRGVFRSLDGGRHWRKVLYENADTGAIDLAFKPGDPQTIYAALWQTRRPPWSVYPPSSGPGSGLFISHDGGEHWSRVTGGGFAVHPGRIGIAVAPSAPDRVFALVDSTAEEGGLYRSEDGGAHWRHVSSDRRIYERGWYFCELTVDPRNADRVYVMDTIVLRSDDGGSHFIALKGDPTGDDFHQMWIDPTDPDRQILGVDQGTLITLDGGKTWSSWYNQPTAQIYHVSTDNRFPYWVYGAQQDSGAVALPSRTDGGDGITLEQFREITAGGESDMIAPDPDDPGIIYGGRVDKLDTRTHQTRDIDPTLAYPALHYRAAWTLPLAFSQRGKSVLYFANQMLFRTTDGGNHWSPASPDLTRADAGVPGNLDAPTAADDDHLSKRRGVIYTIAPSPLDAGTLWVGTDDGLVWHTHDGGAHWQQVTPRALTPWSKVGGIELSHFVPAIAYLAVDRHRLDDDTPYIYRTVDDGASWTRIDAGIPRDAFVNVVREDPARRGLLYAGTEKGMYVSFDDGTHWQSLELNLPATSVRDIDVHGDDVVIATHGRGFWIMDDVTALRQMSTVRAAGVTLFTPAVTYRVRLQEFTGTPFPKDEPMAQNPPAGALVDYVLPEHVAPPVTLTVLDVEGREIRSFSSTDRSPPPDPAKLAFAPEWVRQSPALSSAPGMHRFVWDLHYAPAHAAHARVAPRDAGVWAPPGRYTLVLTVGGRHYRTPLVIAPDPRVEVPTAALGREFALAREVELAWSQASSADADAEKLLDALGKRHASSRAVDEELERVRAALSALSGAPLQAPAPNAPEPTPQRSDSLRALSSDLANLESAVDGADADPSPDALAGYGRLSRMLTAALGEWRDLQAHDVAALEHRLDALAPKSRAP
ncbi:MAG TPA: hypothetical protein VMU67_06390 [Steroidobacteraceae bacterium]|nr:hypothetical protein [Steroidobacteraceae bacterium]